MLVTVFLLGVLVGLLPAVGALLWLLWPLLGRFFRWS